MAGDLRLVGETLGDVLARAELSERDAQALRWCLAELAAEPMPGPWELSRGQVRQVATGDVLASVPYAIGGAEDRATASLICAAPELRAALGME